MIENGLYIVKDLYFSMFEKCGCKFKYNKHEARPTFVVYKISMLKRFFGQYQQAK